MITRTLASVALILTLTLLVASPALAAPPPPSPGVAMGNTIVDLQHVQSMGRQIARQPEADVVHFTWHGFDRISSDPNPHFPYVAYNSYTSSIHLLNQGYGGVIIALSNQSLSSNPAVAVSDSNIAHVALQQRLDPSFPVRPWHLHFPIPGNSLHGDDMELAMGSLIDSGPVICPQMDVQSYPAGSSIVHVVARDSSYGRERLYYWRFDNATWQGPALIDSIPTFGYVLEADQNSAKCAIILHTNRESQFAGAMNVAYYESHTSGSGWISGAELGAGSKHFITSYNDPNAAQAGRHISAVYDFDGALHVIWDERLDPVTTRCIIRHWSSSSGTIRPAASALWSNRRAAGGGIDLSLAKPTLAVGDGSTLCNGVPNRNFLYLLYTRFGGSTPAEQRDSAVTGFMNGELYLNASTDGGQTWSAPANLTNTKTPNCNPGYADTLTGIPQRPDSVCRSEHWASINKIVHDLDMLYISDIDAGASTLGEGNEGYNSVRYLDFPGGTADAPYVCPTMGPQFTSAYTAPAGNACGIEARDGDTLHASLTISNFGNVLLQGQISVAYTNPPSPAAPWLAVNGSEGTTYNLAAGTGDLVYPVTLSPTGLPRGSYQAELRVTHNDPTQPSPQIYPIILDVDACACHANPVCDAAVDVLDVTAVIDHAFRGGPTTADPFCPSPIAATIDGTTDVNCSGETDVLDVITMIGVAFRGRPQTDFCHPCTQPGP
jgi:hypothetical protein